MDEKQGNQWNQCGQGNQKINCAVTSCKFNDMHEQECELNAIVVKPCNDCCNGKAEDESMCGNYQCREKGWQK